MPVGLTLCASGRRAGTRGLVWGCPCDISRSRFLRALGNKGTSVGWTGLSGQAHAVWAVGPAWWLLSCGWNGVRVWPSLLEASWLVGSVFQMKHHHSCLRVTPHLVLCGLNDFLLTVFAMLPPKCFL